MKERHSPPRFSLIKAYDKAPDIRPAEKGACGTMPVAAFQYCEAMRVASSFGWYVSSPLELSLYFDGRDVYFHEDGHWILLKSINLPSEFREYWQSEAPDNLKDMDPPFVTHLFVPGYINIWSGYLIKSCPDWAINIRSLVNVEQRSTISFFEGIVETSVQRYTPLFVNFRIIKTDVEIHIPNFKPLFQIQPIHRSCYQSHQNNIEVHGLEHLNDSPDLWNDYAKTIRATDEITKMRPGRYAKLVRKLASE